MTIFSNWSKSFFLSTYIVSFSTVSINFLGFTSEGKKSTFDCLIKDLALSWVNGIKKIFIIDCKIKKTKEYLIIIFKNSLFLIPLDQKMRVWFWSSYFTSVKKTAKKKTWMVKFH